MSLQRQIYLRNAGLIGESVEQIDELSKNTLGSYVGKAYKDQGKRMGSAGALVGAHAVKTGKAPTSKQVQKMVGKDEVRKDKNRDAGVERAISRLSKEEVGDIEEYLRNAGLINIDETIEHLVVSSNEEVEQLDEVGPKPDYTQYDKMLDDLMKSQGKRLLKKHSAEVKKSRDIESGKALKQHVKKNPGVLKTYSNAVKKDKKMYG
jgi:hypothetical protein